MSRWNSRIGPLLCAASLAALTACGGGGAGDPAPATPPPAASRSFWMGFSPWPWDSTQEAVDGTWATLRAEGDLVSHHIEEGVPWPQAATGVGAVYPASFQALLVSHRTQAAGRRHLVSINPLGQGRDALAPLRSEQLNLPLPAPWSGAALDSAEVKNAYANYALRMAAELSPDVLLTGIEVNLLAHKKPALWPAWLALQCHVYRTVKAAHPDLPVGVSLVAVALLPEWSPEYDLAQQQQALAALAPCVDVIGWSVYPYMSSLLAERLPADFFSRFVSRLPAALQGKAMGISESGYTAQAWSLNGLTWNGTPERQREVLALMLSEAQRLNMRFVAWYAARDYDQLWAGALARDPLALIWRDTGLIDETGAARPALAVWREWRDRPRAP